ncbi:MAG: hypothetical protein ACRDF4_04895 [Rhabdochlamydiaceae bacterium]
MSIDRNSRESSEMFFKRLSLQRISTGSYNFDSLLGGGLPIACITDVYGAAGTGKTQFAFQNAIMTCERLSKLEQQQKKKSNSPYVLFVDCAGSFRPERIVEIAQSRVLDSNKILERISSITVRSVADQRKASERLESELLFSDCRLLIVDDVTVNFVSEFEGEDNIVARQTTLSLYARHLAYLANRRGISVLLTNSVRSRGERGEGETTGEILSAFTLFRLHFTKSDRDRFATLLQPDVSMKRAKFEIATRGIS